MTAFQGSGLYGVFWQRAEGGLFFVPLKQTLTIFLDEFRVVL